MIKKLFIAIEGLSGSGKTTIASLLAEKIGGLYMKSPPPPFDAVRKEVDDLMDPTARVLFYLSGIVQVSRNIERELSTRSVVLDKYVSTTLASARSKGIKAEVPTFAEILRPDFSFYLDVDDATRLKRIGERDRDTSYRKPDMLGREQRIRKEFGAFNLTRIDNNSTPEDCLGLILEVVNRS